MSSRWINQSVINLHFPQCHPRNLKTVQRDIFTTLCSTHFSHGQCYVTHSWCTWIQRTRNSSHLQCGLDSQLVKHGSLVSGLKFQTMMLCQLDGSSLQLNIGDVYFWKPQMRWSFIFLWAFFSLMLWQCCACVLVRFSEERTLYKGLEDVVFGLVRNTCFSECKLSQVVVTKISSFVATHPQRKRENDLAEFRKTSRFGLTKGESQLI